MKSHTNMRSQSLLYGSVCVTLMLILGASSMGLAADWPNYRGPNYDGISKETGWNAAWQGEPTVAWKKALGWGFASMAVSDGRVYATGNKDDNDILYCYDAATGKEIWKHSYPCPLYDKQHEGGPCATPTVEGNAVYVFSKAGDALRLNAKTGEVVWHKNPAKASGIKPP